MNDGWVQRSQTLPDGQRAVWRERPMPGQPGAVEQHFLSSPTVVRMNCDPVRLLSPVLAPVAVRSQRSVRRAVTVSRSAVVFTEAARADLAGELASWDGREIGGPLVGTSIGSQIVVAHAGGLGIGVETPRGESWLRPRFGRYLDFARSYDADLVGCWHSHGGGHSELASEADEALWHDLRAALEVPVYVGVIVAPRRAIALALNPWQDEVVWSWENPRLSTYLVTAEGCQLTTPTLTGEARHALTA
jgi:hypothetical protein